MKLLRCPICGKVRVAPVRNKSCSPTCARKLLTQQYGEDWYRRLGAVAGVERGKGVRRRADARWRAQWPDVPASLADEIYARAYASGYARGVLAGRRKGWAEALGERPEPRRMA